MIVPPNIPVCLKHMTLAIYQSKTVKGSGAQRFENAFSIARANLVKTQHLLAQSDVGGTVEDISLTAKGRWLEGEKRRSRGTAQKQAEFDRLYLAWAKAKGSDR